MADAAKGFIPEDAAKTPSCPAQATTQIALIANLYADTMIATVWDPARPEATSSFVVSGSPYTSDGHVVDLRVFFAKSSAHTWTWHALASNVGKPSALLGDGELTFAADGALQAAETFTPLRLPHTDGSLSAPVELSFGTPVGKAADGFDGVTSTSEPSRLISFDQDGSAQPADSDCSKK